MKHFNRGILFGTLMALMPSAYAEVSWQDELKHAAPHLHQAKTFKEFYDKDHEKWEPHTQRQVMEVIERVKDHEWPKIEVRKDHLLLTVGQQTVRVNVHKGEPRQLSINGVLIRPEDLKNPQALVKRVEMALPNQQMRFSLLDLLLPSAHAKREKSGGFDWGSALIGGAVGVFAALLIGDLMGDDEEEAAAAATPTTQLYDFGNGQPIYGGYGGGGIPVNPVGGGTPGGYYVGYPYGGAPYFPAYPHYGGGYSYGGQPGWNPPPLGPVPPGQGVVAPPIGGPVQLSSNQGGFPAVGSVISGAPSGSTATAF